MTKQDTPSKGGGSPATDTPPKGGPAGDPANPASDPKKVEKLEARVSDQQSEISRAQGENAQLQRQLANMQAHVATLGRGPPAAPGPTTRERLKKAFSDADENAFEEALVEHVEKVGQGYAAAAVRASAEARTAERDMGVARELGVDNLEDVTAGLKGAGVEVGAMAHILQKDGMDGLIKKLSEVRDGRKQEADARALLGTLASGGSAKGAGLDVLLQRLAGTGTPGQAGSPGGPPVAGESPVFMHDIGKAPHARQVKDERAWQDADTLAFAAFREREAAAQG